jgi:hypothetical protein
LLVQCHQFRSKRRVMSHASHMLPPVQRILKA